MEIYQTPLEEAQGAAASAEAQRQAAEAKQTVPGFHWLIDYAAKSPEVIRAIAIKQKEDAEG